MNAMANEHGTPGQQRGEPAPGRRDEIDLAEYGAALWRRRRLLLVAPVACAAVAFVVTMAGPRTYEAQLTLMVNVTKPNDADKDTRVVTPSDFEPIVQSAAVAAAVIRELHLDRPPYSLASNFRPGTLSVGQVQTANLLRLTVRFPDPNLVAQIANRIGAHAVELARKVSADEAIQARDTIGQQIEQQKARLDEAEARLRAYRDEAQIEALQQDVEAALEKRRREVQHVDGKKLPELTALYDRQMKLDRLQVDRDLAQKLYFEAASRYEIARVQVATQSAQLQVIDLAVPPDRPVSRGVVRNTAIAGLLAFCIVAVVALLAHAVTTAARRHPPAAVS